MSKSSRSTGRRSRVAATLVLGAVGSASLLASAGAPAFAAAPAARSVSASTAARAYTFTTLNDQADPTFNQLLGINNKGHIVGYFGSGDPGHPNKGYQLLPPHGQANYVNENFPGSIQTQVTALNNNGATAGFWVGANGANHGFVEWQGVFTSYDAPNSHFTQILSINNAGTAVGFYNDKAGVSHAFKLNHATGKFTNIKVPGKNSTASGINNNGDITGFTTGGNGQVIGWLLHQGRVVTFAYPGGGDTTPFGINNKDEIVGAYLDADGNSHGFTLTTPLTHAQFAQVDDPNGVGSTVVNGVNDGGTLVGFYTDAAMNVDGFLAR